MTGMLLKIRFCIYQMHVALFLDIFEALTIATITEWIAKGSLTMPLLPRQNLFTLLDFPAQLIYKAFNIDQSYQRCHQARAKRARPTFV